MKARTIILTAIASAALAAPVAQATGKNALQCSAAKASAKSSALPLSASLRRPLSAATCKAKSVAKVTHKVRNANLAPAAVVSLPSVNVSSPGYGIPDDVYFEGSFLQGGTGSVAPAVAAEAQPTVNAVAQPAVASPVTQDIQRDYWDS